MTNTTDSVSVRRPLKLVPSEYFDRLIARMKKSGYELFSRVTIDTNDCGYRVGVKYARETALFFHLPNKKLIIQLVFHEYDYPHFDEPRQYWSIRLYPVFKPYERLLKMTYVPFDRRGPSDPSNPSLATIPFYETMPEIPGFQWYGSHYEQSSTNMDPIDSTSLGTTLVRLLYPALKYIGYGQFKDLQITSFWPHYTFPNSHQTFWSRFNNEALQKIVERPWGGEDIRRR